MIEYTWQQFDANGNRLASQQLSSSGGTITTWATNGWTYDGLNRVLTETTKDGAVTTYGLDALGDVTNRTMPGGLTWSATYNNAGQITLEQDAALGGGSSPISIIRPAPTAGRCGRRTVPCGSKGTWAGPTSPTAMTFGDT